MIQPKESLEEGMYNTVEAMIRISSPFIFSCSQIGFHDRFWLLGSLYGDQTRLRGKTDQRI